MFATVIQKYDNLMELLRKLESLIYLQQLVEDDVCDRGGSEYIECIHIAKYDLLKKSEKTIKEIIELVKEQNFFNVTE